jgi:hypothetical protein
MQHSDSIPHKTRRSTASGNFELHLRHRRHKLCLCGHCGDDHNILSCKLCDCEYFRLSAYQPKNIPATSVLSRKYVHIVAGL